MNKKIKKIGYADFYKVFFLALLIVGGFLLLASATNVLAQDEPDAPCGGDCPSGQLCNVVTDSCETVGGDDGGGSGSVQLPNFLGVSTISELFLKIVNFLMALALPFAALMIVWAGFQFVTAQGSEDKLTKAKRNLAWTAVGVLVILAAKEIVAYISELLGGSGTSSLTTKINNILTQFYAVLFILVTVYFFWGVVQFVRSSASGGKEMEEGKRHMVWGIIGMTVMAGAWGIVAILKSIIQ